MSILKILPSAIDSTANYAFGSVTANGVDLGATVAAAFNAANTVSPLDSFARQTANAAFLEANTKLSTSGGTITGNLIVNAFTANTITANGVNLGTAVAEAFVLANNANKSTTSDTAPANPKVGDTWFDTVTGVILRYTYDGVSNNWIDISGPQNAGYIYQSYSITPNTSTINETTGNTVIYTVSTTNTADNTVLYWTNSGTTVAADFSDSVSNGSVTIINNSGTITRSLSADLTTETSETIILSLRTGSNTGPVVAVASSVTVGDTSTTPFTVSYLVVAGGGGLAGNGGGGGAGGVLYGDLVLTSSSYTITVGAGGSNQTLGGDGNGANSSIVPVGGGTSVITVGGGAGGGIGYGGQPGGSGGGWWSPTGQQTTGVPGQGNGGGSLFNGNWGNAGGGGGGAGGSGGPGYGGGPAPSTFDFYGGNGGDGSVWPRNNVRYGGGGGGAATEIQGSGTAIGGTGGLGGGGDGGRYDPPSFASAPLGYGTDGQVNRGGGAGGKTNTGDLVGAKSGGSGIVIITYAGSTAVATGGTITQSGGNTFHTFTSSGTFTLN